jgi:excisionase family DNA binding protein
VALPLSDDAPQFAWPAEVMTCTEVAKTVRMTPKTVRLHIRRGRLRAVQFDGGPYRVRREDAQRWIEAQLVEPDAGALAVDRHLARTKPEPVVAQLTSGRRRRSGRVST